MVNFFKKHDLDLSRPRTFLYGSIWTAAGVVGVLAFAYARLIASLQTKFLNVFAAFPIWTSVAAPFVFVAATWTVRRFAPDAKGSGIPQVLAAIETAKEHKGEDSVWRSRMVSPSTAFIKILSSSLGIIGGASIGREGPTVQIAASGFAWIGSKVRKWAPQVDFQTFLIAGAAAGVAAAFNTPLAGITFALEEIADGMFGPFRQLVMLAVIIAGVIAQGFSGNYLYFGLPVVPKTPVALLMPEALIIGVLGGAFGGLFAYVLAQPQVARLPKHWAWRAFVTGLLCGAIGYFTHADTSGSGYEVTRKVLESDTMENASVMFPVYKLVTTICSYLSGMAGGIFSPALAIGAGVGVSIAKLANFHNFTACALMGMVAFFSGAVRAPLTAVVIVMEMTDKHMLILPFMIAAYLAHSVGRRIMPVPLYHYLAKRHLEG